MATAVVLSVKTTQNLRLKACLVSYLWHVRLLFKWKNKNAMSRRHTSRCQFFSKANSTYREFYRNFVSYVQKKTTLEAGLASRSRESQGFSWESESKNYACQSRSRKNMLNPDSQSFAGMEGFLCHETNYQSILLALVKVGPLVFYKSVEVS